MRTDIHGKDKGRYAHICVTVLILALIIILGVVMNRPKAMAVLSQGIIYKSPNPDEVMLLCILSWDSSFTEDILAILRNENVKITFAVTGSLAEAKPDLIAEIANDGHSVLTCGMNYTDAQTLSKDELTESILQSVEIIERAGAAVTGFYNGSSDTSKAQRAARALGLSCYSCTHDLLCGRGTKDDIINRAKQYAHKGNIIAVTPTEGLKDALPEIIRLGSRY